MSEREEVKEIRFIKPEPVIALRLEKRKPLIIPEAYYRWAVGWIKDVGTVLRSREMMVYTVASAVQYAGITLAVSILKRLLGENSIIVRIISFFSRRGGGGG